MVQFGFDHTVEKGVGCRRRAGETVTPAETWNLPQGPTQVKATPQVPADSPQVLTHLFSAYLLCFSHFPH